MKNLAICTLLLLAVSVSAAAPKEQPFTVASFFEGSWIIAKRTISLESGEVLGEMELMQYNVTKTDENEYDIFPLEANTYRRSQEANQVVMIPSHDYSCDIKQYSAQTDSFETFVHLNFIPMLPRESFISAGLAPVNAKEEYEITTLGKNHFSLKLTNRSTGEITMYSATRVIIPPPKTFMQKYGPTLMMAGMIILQMISKGLLSNGMAKEKTE